jgi:hypothetical protein
MLFKNICEFYCTKCSAWILILDLASLGQQWSAQASSGQPGQQWSTWPPLDKTIMTRLCGTVQWSCCKVLSIAVQIKSLSVLAAAFAKNHTLLMLHYYIV